MPNISRNEYMPAERKRCGAAYKRLWEIITAKEPDAGELRRALAAELAAGLPIDWPDGGGWTLLHWAVNLSKTVRAGLPQILIEAGADVNVKNRNGNTPLGSACRKYGENGAPEYLALIDALLETGARPELDESWKRDLFFGPGKRARRDWLEAYIKTWPQRLVQNRERGARDRANDAAPAFDYAL